MHLFTFINISEHAVAPQQDGQLAPEAETIAEDRSKGSNCNTTLLLLAVVAACQTDNHELSVACRVQTW